MLFLDEAGSTFASGGHDGTIMLWSRTGKEPTRVLQGHRRSVAKMIAQDNLLISGSYDNTVRIWELATGECLRVLEGHSNYVSVLMFNPDGSLLRTGSGGDGDVRIWNWRAGYVTYVTNFFSI
jgi:WD40 repeat protein